MGRGLRACRRVVAYHQRGSIGGAVPERRALLRWGLTAAFGVALPAAAAAVASGRARSTNSVGTPGAGTDLPGAFVTELPVPPVLRPLSTDGGVDRYEIRQMERPHRFRAGTDTAIWG